MNELFFNAFRIDFDRPGDLVFMMIELWFNPLVGSESWKLKYIRITAFCRSKTFYFSLERFYQEFFYQKLKIWRFLLSIKAFP